MAPEYGLTVQEMRELERKAGDKVKKFLDYQVENADVIFEAGYR
jgi:hypothetical protein